MFDLDQIRIEQNDDILFLTIGKYKLFLKSQDEGGLDALLLFLHYMFTARLQQTNSIKAKDQYVRNALKFGIIKLKKAKSLLRKWDLIKYKQDRNPDGTLKEQYIVLNIAGGTNFVPVVQETAPPVDRPIGGEKQMLKQENKCLNKKKKCLIDVSSEYYKITEQFFTDLITIVNPPTYKNRKPDLTKWSEHIRLLHESDKIEYKDMQEIWKWAMNDSFWKGNILSTEKFRKHYNILSINKSKIKQEESTQERLKRLGLS